MNNSTVKERLRWLRSLHKQLIEHRKHLLLALHEDLGKSNFEAEMTELMPLLDASRLTLRKLRSWMRPHRARMASYNLTASGRLHPEPYGKVLIVSTWNYPLLLTLEPLIGAIAAGNKVVLRLPTQAAATTFAIREIINRVDDETNWVEATNAEVESLLDRVYDYIFYTGNPVTGAKILAAAAPHLTPVTLELGGKSPCVVGAGTNLKLAARRIVWGKFVNAGQTCVAPDYLLVDRKIKDDFVHELRQAVKAAFGNNPQESRDYPRIINQYHYNRLCGLLATGRLITGGEHSAEERYIAPTILDQITEDDPIMREEIFGPLLPIMEYSDLIDAVNFINARPKPLALYGFLGTRHEERYLIEHTSSGGACLNDVVLQLTNPGMPFGGVGQSGMGRYHGHYTFETFSHLKPVMRQSGWLDFPLRYAPFKAWKRKVLNYFIH